MGSREPHARCRLLSGALLIVVAVAAGSGARAQLGLAQSRDMVVDDLVRTAWQDYKARRHDEARMKLERAQLLAPDRADVHFELGETLFWLGRHAQALAHFERVLLLEPTMAVAYHGVGQSCLVLAIDERTDPKTRKQLLDRADQAFALTLLLDPTHAMAKVAVSKLADARRSRTYGFAWLEELIVLLVFVLLAEAVYRLRHTLVRPRLWLAGLREYRWPVLLFAGTRALVLGAFAIAEHVLEMARNHPWQILHHWHPVLDTVAGRWDSNIYADVALLGYRLTLDNVGLERLWSTIGQFPLVPVLQRSVTFTIGSPHVSALILPHAALLFASLFLYAWFRRLHGERIAIVASCVVLLHPGSLFGSVLYTESFALLGLAGLVYCSERDAPFEAVLWGVFAGLARLSSIAIVPWLLLEAWQRRGDERMRRLWPALSPLLGVALFMLYLQLQVGDALWYFRELRDVRFAGRGTFIALSEAVDMVTHLWRPGQPRGGPWLALLLAVTCLGAYLLVIRAQLRAREFGPALFVAAGVVLALTSSLAAQPRYLWLLFVAAPVIARRVDRPRLRYALSALACAVLVASAIAFSRWYYIT
jgi:tetratricopeptide (TPR) repeat protein